MKIGRRIKKIREKCKCDIQTLDNIDGSNYVTFTCVHCGKTHRDNVNNNRRDFYEKGGFKYESI